MYVFNMKSVILLLIALILFTNTICSQAQTKGMAFNSNRNGRVALCIGISKYDHQTPLRNPLNDADSMYFALQACGFQVQPIVYDPDKKKLKEILDTWYPILQKAEEAVFYYSGHGAEFGGLNYILPRDTRMLSEADAQEELVSIDWIHNRMQSAGVTTRILIVDACRNNPFKAALNRSMLFNELANPRVAGSAFLFGTSRGGLSSDGGTGFNGTFTTALLSHIRTPGLEIAQLVRAVRKEMDKLAPNSNLQKPATTLY
jgi:uncharacterized caspase-like protein